MWKHFLVTLTITCAIKLSVQHCEFSCLSDGSIDNYCVEQNEVKINATIVKTGGVVDFQFNHVCNFSNYKILLKYSDGLCGSTNYFKQHSTYKFKEIRDSNGIDTKGFDKCSKNGRVLLQNIQTGCYEIFIFELETNIIFFKTYVYWQTSYIKQKVNPLNTSTIHGSRKNGTELIFKIKNPILNFNPEFSLMFECNNDCPERSYNLIEDVNNSKRLILNPKDENTLLNISCDLGQYKNQYGIADCVISPVSVNNYSIRISFVGDPYKCGQNHPEKNTINIFNVEVKSDEVLQEPSKYFHQSSENIFGPVLAFICILLSLFIVITTIKLSRVKIHNSDNKIFNIEGQQISRNNSLSEIKTDQTLLLLYARNSEDIMTTLSLFRNILTYQGIQVYDIYDPERLREIYEDYFNWFLNLITRENIKIVIFLTPGGRNLSHMLQTQDSIDNIYSFAIKYLLNRISNDSDFFKNIFVVHFSNDVYNYSYYDSFSPHLRFRVPDDFFELLQRILNTERVSLSDKSNIEFKRFQGCYVKHNYS